MLACTVAYMALVTSNAQSELSALERGLHALHATEKGKHGRSVAAYAREIGRKQQAVSDEVSAARVFEEVTSRDVTCPEDQPRHLAETHAAPRWLWPSLVEKLEAESLTVVRLREIVSELKGIPEPLPAFNTARIAERVVARTMRPSEVGAMNDAYSAASGSDGGRPHARRSASSNRAGSFE